jgi:hypothetical protein
MRLGDKRPEHSNSGTSGDHEREEGAASAAVADSLDAWIGELAAALALDPTGIDRDLLLDVSRATHRVARAAAPFTLLFVGLAAGREGAAPKRSTGPQRPHGGWPPNMPSRPRKILQRGRSTSCR